MRFLGILNYGIPPPSVLIGPPPPESTQVETEAEGEHATEGGEEVEQLQRDEPPAGATMTEGEGVPVPNPPSYEAMPLQHDITQYLASPEELAILRRGLSMTSILNEPILDTVPHSTAEEAINDGPELSLGGNLNVPPEA